MIIREPQKLTSISKSSLGQLSSVHFYRPAYYSTEFYSSMQVPGTRVSREFEVFYRVRLCLCISMVSRCMYFITESSNITNITAVRALKTLMGELVRLYCLPKLYVGNLDFIGYTLTIQLYGFSRVGL